MNADGSATMSLTITALRQELTRPVLVDKNKSADETSVVDMPTPEGAK